MRSTVSRGPASKVKSCDVRGTRRRASPQRRPSRAKLPSSTLRNPHHRPHRRRPAAPAAASAPPRRPRRRDGVQGTSSLPIETCVCSFRAALMPISHEEPSGSKPPHRTDPHRVGTKAPNRDGISKGTYGGVADATPPRSRDPGTRQRAPAPPSPPAQPKSSIGVAVIDCPLVPTSVRRLSELKASKGPQSSGDATNEYIRRAGHE